jgi:pimeloyl-ACP methyl ester carboxylesterase
MTIWTRYLTPDRFLSAMRALLVVATVLLWCQACGSRTATITAATLPEELVRVQAKDGIPNGGVIYSPPKDVAKPIAIIWIHGWGTNFYAPTYVMIGRALAERGYTTIGGNTRMHDLGNVEWIGDKRIRGGGYWGVASDQVRDIAAWIDLAESRGFEDVILVGHSAGWAAVTQYQAEAQDRRVVGVVVASGSVRPGGPIDPDQIAQATRMMADGHPDDLVRDPKRSFPSFISAATMLDIANAPPELRDFYGTQKETTNPAVIRIHCPLLAFYGTKGDVGDAADLELLKSFVQRQPRGPSSVETTMIKSGDHMYTGEEAQVADIIAKWAGTLKIGGK